MKINFESRQVPLEQEKQKLPKIWQKLLRSSAKFSTVPKVSTTNRWENSSKDLPLRVHGHALMVRFKQLSEDIDRN
jgi:hypothetical protein